jgi:hypothetical protein
MHKRQQGMLPQTQRSTQETNHTFFSKNAQETKVERTPQERGETMMSDEDELRSKMKNDLLGIYFYVF